jgi:hypothetical protein
MGKATAIPFRILALTVCGLLKPTVGPRLRRRRWRLRLDRHLAAVHQIHRRVEDHLVARRDAGPDLDRRPEVVGHIDPSDLCDAVLDHRHLQPVTIEDDCVGGKR